MVETAGDSKSPMTSQQYTALCRDVKAKREAAYDDFAKNMPDSLAIRHVDISGQKANLTSKCDFISDDKDYLVLEFGSWKIVRFSESFNGWRTNSSSHSSLRDLSMVFEIDMPKIDVPEFPYPKEPKRFIGDYTCRESCIIDDEKCTYPDCCASCVEGSGCDDDQMCEHMKEP